MEEQTEFTVLLKGFDAGKKIPIIKEVRAITGLGLKEAKQLVEEQDRPIKEAVSKEEAQKLKEQLETARHRGGAVNALLRTSYLSRRRCAAGSASLPRAHRRARRLAFIGAPRGGRGR